MKSVNSNRHARKGISTEISQHPSAQNQPDNHRGRERNKGCKAGVRIKLPFPVTSSIIAYAILNVVHWLMRTDRAR